MKRKYFLQKIYKNEKKIFEEYVCINPGKLIFIR